MMRKLFLSLVVTLVAVVLLCFLLESGKETVDSFASPSIRLELRGPAVALAQTDSTFPSDEAGLAAYIKVDSLDIEKAVDGFDELYLMGGDWVVGIVWIEVYPPYSTGKYTRRNVYVYIDSQGWVVAYFEKDTPTGAIMVWTEIDEIAPELVAITTTTLEEALDKVLSSAEMDFDPFREQVGYFDFQYPDANSITLAASVTRGTIDRSREFTLALAEESTVYSESVCLLSNHFSSERRPKWYSKDPSGNLRFDTETGLLHLIEASFSAGLSYRYGFTINGGSLGDVVGIAVVLVYKTP